MPTVPIYERSQQVSVGGVNPIATPSVPNFTAPTEAAFGSDLFKAQAQKGAALLNAGKVLGDTGNTLVNIANKVQEDNDKNEIIKIDPQARAEIQTALYSDEKETITDITGKQITRTKGVMKRKLSEANGAIDDYDNAYLNIKKKYVDVAPNDRVKEMVSRLIDSTWLNYRDNVFNHQASEKEKDFTLNMETSVKSRIKEATSISDIDKLNKFVTESAGILGTGLKTLGMSQDVIDAKIKDMGSEMVMNSVAGVLDKDPAQARKLYEVSKTLINPDVASKIDGMIRGKELEDIKYAIFDNASKLKLADGTSNLQAMKQVVYNNPSLQSTVEKDKVWADIKALAGEQDRMLGDRRAAANDAFMNEIYSMKKNGATLDQVLKRSPMRYGHDTYDIALKEEAVRKLYTNPTKESNPNVYINLWEGIRNKTVNQTGIDNAMQRGDVSVSDWEALRKDYYNSKNDSQKTSSSLAYDQVSDLARATFGNAKTEWNGAKIKKSDAFIYTVKKNTEGKTPEEVALYAQKLLKEYPTGDKFLGIWERTKRGSEDAFKNQQQKDSFVGNLQEQIGADVYKKLGDDPNLVLGFVEKNGGTENLKIGTPRNNAIKSLINRGLPVTQKNIEAIVKYNKNGIIDPSAQVILGGQ